MIDKNEWLANPRNLYCGRANAVMDDEGFGNPYKVNTYGREKAIEMYKRNVHITPTQLMKLKNAKQWGCWCAPNERCHTDVLFELCQF